MEYTTQIHNLENHQHCWHLFSGPIWMVLPDGCVIEQCCECPANRVIHRDHAGLHRRLERTSTRRSIRWQD